MTASQSIPGLASGFDTASIVEQLMKIEKIPYEKLDIKKQTQQLKLQAYQAVNTMLMKFRTSVSSLSSQKLWKSKAATSTNDKVVTATANEYAVNGSYSFKVAQLATATQFMSKGFASSKTALVKQATGETAYKIGEITMNNAKSRVDTSAKLETLNGGKGVYRGQIRVSDGANGTSIVDLSGCDTMDDVVHALNNSTGGARISAAVRDGVLTINDESGGSGDLRIQNVGAGSTATDLGISGSFTGGVASGRNVYVMGNEMGLNLLNDGMGVEEGMIRLRVSNSTNYMDIEVNVDDCATVGDIIKRVNQEIQFRYENDIVDSNGGGRGGELLDGLRFGLNADKNAFALSGTTENFSYSWTDLWDTTTPARQRATASLGLDEKTYTADASGTVEFARILGDVNSPMLKNLSGVNGYGVGQSKEQSQVPMAFDGTTKLSWLNGGKGLDISRPLSIRMREGGQDGSNSDALLRVYEDIIDMDDLKTITSNPNSTVDDLLNFLNTSIANYAADPANQAAGLTGMKFSFEELYAGGPEALMVVGAQGGYKYEINGTMMNDLGLLRLDAAGNPIQIDSSYGDYDARKEAVDKFYDLNGELGDTAYVDSGDSVNLDSAKGALTTIGELVKLHGKDPATDQADITTWIQGLLTSSPITMTVGGVTKTIDLSSLASGYTDASTVKDLVDDINAAIQSEFGAGASVPQLRSHTYGDRLQWSNMDFTQDFAVTGDLVDALNLDRNIAVGDVAVQFNDWTEKTYDVMAPGYFEKLDVNDANKDDILLSELRGGAGLDLNGAGTDTLDITVNGNLIQISRQEIFTAIGGSLDVTLEDYCNALNGIIQGKAAALGLPAGDAFTFEFQVGDGGLVIGGLDNVDSFKVEGALADVDVSGIRATSVDTGVDNTKTYEVGQLNAYRKHQDDTISGLGSITVKLGSQEVTLTTTGLDGENTLTDLIEHLNSQLTGAFRDIRFTINNAGTGIAVDNGSDELLTFVNDPGNRLARDLGLISEDGKTAVEVDSHSFHNSTSLGRNYLSRATRLSDFTGLTELTGDIQITNALGVSAQLSLEGLKTVGDLIDYVNGFNMGIQLEINEFGEGIRAYEAYDPNNLPPTKPTGNISISDVDGGTFAKVMGIAGTGVRDLDGWGDNSVLDGSMKTTIDVMSSDTLESLMYRISEKGGYKTAIINDGSGTNPYRLTISSATTGEASDFVIESDLDIFGFNQTSRGKDSKVLYGDPNSSASPILLSSSTNSNSNAILGLTLDLKSVSSEYVTINVNTDKEKVTEEIKNMVQTYNDLNELVSILDAYDEETGEPGVLFGDTNTRKLMEDITDMFYLIFNPNQKMLGSTNNKGEQNTWTWMDIGVSLNAKNTASDGTGNWYSTMDLDLDALDEMVAKNWDTLYEMLAGQRNASDSTLDSSVKASASFNGKAATGFSADNAINGDSNTGSWGVNNGFMADGTIEDGENEYTIYFQKPTTMSRMSIYHYDSDTALKNFTVEYMDANTGKWEVLREISNNSVEANHLGVSIPTAVSAIRIKATSTNADDDKFRLLDVQVFEDIGLAGQLNHLTSKLGDTTDGWLASMNSEVNESLKDIEEQMERLQERLDVKEASLWKRFTAMESALGQLQNQSNYFTSMMDSMSTSKK